MPMPFPLLAEAGEICPALSSYAPGVVLVAENPLGVIYRNTWMAVSCITAKVSRPYELNGGHQRPPTMHKLLWCEA